MKAIKVTQLIKDQNPHLNLVVNSYLKGLVNKFWVTEKVDGGYKGRTDLHDVDGWKELITPSYNPTTHTINRNVINEVDDHFEYGLTAYTQAQINSNTLSAAESQREALIQEKVKAQITSDAQQETDTQTLLDNQALYPMWEEGLNVIVGEKYQWFDAENNLVLWEVIQAHKTLENWQPKDVPALFKRVAFDNEYLAWVQPTGAHDAYNIDDIVWYPNVGDTLYISTVNANVYAPLQVAGQWIVYEA